MKAWLRGWYETLRIMVFHRELYRSLRDESFDPDDFIMITEVPFTVWPDFSDGDE
jgi:hypothetical protein